MGVIVLEGIREFDDSDGEEPLAYLKRIPACRAIWAAVEKAEKNGLYELYGFEWFHEGDSGYEAVFVVRTAKGTSCFYAYDETHQFRTDPLTVPSHPVETAALEMLRRRVAMYGELPEDRQWEASDDEHYRRLPSYE